MKKKPPDIRKQAALTRFPTPVAKNTPKMSDAEKIAYIADKFRDIMLALGLDLNDDSLRRTPDRIAKMYVNEIFYGLDLEKFPDISVFEDRFKHSDKGNIVSMKVSFTSFCEHHFVPMVGQAHVAYLPHKKLIGLSKIPRIVRYFASRPQVQERLTAQIADALTLILDTEDVAVSTQAEHYCIAARGIQDDDSHAVTHVLRGEFNKNSMYRQEFFESINRQFR